MLLPVSESCRSATYPGETVLKNILHVQFRKQLTFSVKTFGGPMGLCVALLACGSASWGALYLGEQS